MALERDTTMTKTNPDPCGCARQSDLWLCQARPSLHHEDPDIYCELGKQLDETDGNDWADPREAPGRKTPWRSQKP